MFTQYVSPSAQKIKSESGMALLVSVLILVLVMGVITAAALVVSRSSVVSSAQISENNEARTAALVGIAAMTRDAQNIHSTPNTATTGSSSCSSGLLGFGSLLCSINNSVMGSGGTPVAIPNGGNGGMAVEMPIGTTASATITNANPYYQATVNAVVTANTFSPAQGSTPSQPGIVTIISQGQSGNASATAEAVIAAMPVQTAASSTQTNAINMNGNTSFSGDVTVEGGTPGAEQNLSDNGSISSGGSYNGFNNVYATQSISSSGSSNNPNENLFSDQNITASGSGSYGSLKALGNISTSGGVTSAYDQANGTVTVNSGSGTTIISGDGTAGSGGVNLENNATSGTITTDGSITQSSGTVQQLYADGNYTASSNPTVGSGVVGGAISGSGNISGVQSVSGYTVGITPLNSVTVQTPDVNVYPLAADANFAFYPPTAAQSSAGVVADVVVNNVNGFTSGQTYYLYNITSYPPHSGYLCTSDTGYNYDCTNIAQGFSAYNAEITYSGGQWTLNGDNVAPGVLWFDGNLSVQNGTYNDSLLATGDIQISDSSAVVNAPNYAGPDAVCGYENSDYGEVYPTNFCSSGFYSGSGTYSNYNPASIGNIALYSGGYDASGDFTGGDISLPSGEASIGGDVIAANTIQSGSNTTIAGYIVSGGEANNGEQNSFGGSTTINLQNLPSTFNPSTPQTPGGYSATAPYAPPPPETVMKLMDMYWLN